MDIRPARPEDVPALDGFLRQSFGASEAELVRRLCIDGDMVLTMVARDPDLVGAAVFSRMAVEVNGGEVPAVALAPLAVAGPWRRQGVGEALVAAGHDALAKAGWVLSFVLGDPAYYGRFGYAADLAQGFDSPYAGEHLMALPLQTAGMPCGVRGIAAHAPAFAALSEDA
ncbi:GNAT family N-acetyltransferase [Sphingomonas spermidinifaciens]|uniref:GNAT family N-acetyltransferase n=1 Tax=Sphingomonas spermidinifaciens TaxID=1141889 RepID=A0A2A4B296_9SPHN|nr:N-acetyltransferase [Sphingomonas spermidinifaciens]PCD02062.1 GNAT family N-acetyltransferase [Sphingomonas spermidinifaciens]